ncbi:FABP family protein [Xylanimonas protaetiae]|uniref:Ferric nitrobindin-like protein n=1 Tax=Xylanimonas protaetiae TaxID=2509457 RepID=A0A4P6F186_9MICO|nr:FABP family protein [Xylanimonas protaetiae]QAY69224.1 FABP family protein [Xylanimonas protaetiae]
MPFAFDETLAPELYPLAWLVGRWRGAGVLAYPGIERRRVAADVVFDHDGGPYLRYEATLRVLEGDVPERVDLGAPDADFALPTDDEVAAAAVWTTETGYWRASTDTLDGLTADQHTIEVLLADASGRLTAFLGWVGGGRVELASQRTVRTSTAPDVSGSRRMLGLVGGRLFWSEDLVAFGQPLQSYSSGQLTRLDGAPAGPESA